MELTIDTCLTETERYGDEVLNANWLPQIALMFGVVQDSHASGRVKQGAPEDPDSFLRRLYLAQE